MKIEKWKDEQSFKLYAQWQNEFEKRFCGFKKPVLLNAQCVLTADFEKIFVLPVFIRPGRQFYVIKSGIGTETISLFKSIIGYREEQIPPY